MKIVTILGARPQFIKASPVSRALQQAGISEFLLHTGQHYDPEMSQHFFAELGLPQPAANLGIGAGDRSGGQAGQTGRMLAGIAPLLQEVKPDAALVYGDTNSTLAGALAAVKLHIPLAHVEAGLRAYNRRMEEEHNRVLTDHCADLLFCPTQQAVDNLAAEGIHAGVYLTGDVMYDAAMQFGELAGQRSTILADLGLAEGAYALATIHRAYNTDDLGRLGRLMAALTRLELEVVFPVHPRTQKALDRLDGWGNLGGWRTQRDKIHFIEPLGYLDMLNLERHARRILTDSGGVQKEAYFFGVPCITLRPETEWVETVAAGWNRVVDADVDRIVWAAEDAPWPDPPPPAIFGNGQAAQQIVDILKKI